MKSDKYNKGMKVRREVLGDEYVDRALNLATDFTKPLQDLVTENCWGEIWTKDVIPNKTRSLITIAILSSLKANTELKGHVLGALRNVQKKRFKMYYYNVQFIVEFQRE